MYIEQIYTGCLAQASYYIESEGAAAIVDPMRDIDAYLELAKKRNTQIKYVLNTHFHADFVSGHLDLAAKTDAIVVFGPHAMPKYRAFIAEDNEFITLGDIKIKILHTPGHTIESTCFLVIDKNNEPTALFSGDTLFIGDVGRPDLMSGNLSKEILGAKLYESLNTKIKTLPDSVIVYPGHGAGSACGKNLGKESSSTIGEQKKFNYALKEMSMEAFIKIVTDDQPPVPAYFFKDAQININGHTNLETVYSKSLKRLSVEAADSEISKGAMVLDTRVSSAFASGFIPGAVNVDLDGQFAIWVGTLINIDQPLLIVADKGKEKEAITRLARIGFENVVGYLDCEVAKWKSSLDTIQVVAPSELDLELLSLTNTLLDVRRSSEVEKDKIKGAYHISLHELNSKLNELDKNKTIVVYCAGGYRSMIAASILKRNGFKNVINVSGGINLVKNLRPELVETY
ncbi:MAG: MBL fold metallo-hydrolase [Bacteroidetes bacterium]|nr:MBL fold metallo-hydrolase [Bacteroidota bacterium]